MVHGLEADRERLASENAAMKALTNDQLTWEYWRDRARTAEGHIAVLKPLVQSASSLVIRFGVSIEQEPVAEKFAAECGLALAAIDKNQAGSNPPASTGLVPDAVEKSLKEVEKKISDVEFYSPTMPLNYQEYHGIIRNLIVLLRLSGRRVTADGGAS